MQSFDRIFCFGCSFTEYQWPTWATILQKDLDIPVYNWGLCGVGNRAILSKMIQCDIKHKFTERDLIMVVWTSWTREDRYITGHWRNGGNILNNEFYDRNFISKYWDWENDIINNATSIISANKSFNIFLNGSIVKVSDPKDIYIPNKDDERKIELQNQRRMIDFYVNHLPKMVYFDMNNNSYYNKTTTDGHPDIMLHKDFVMENIYKPLGITMKESTKRDVQLFYDHAVRAFGTFKDTKYAWENMVNAAKDLWQYGDWQRSRVDDWDSNV